MAGKAEKKTWDEEMKNLFKDFDQGGFHTAADPDPRLFRFWDIHQRFFSLMGDDKLVASPNDSNSTEQFISVLPNNALDVRKQAIFMGIHPKTVMNCVQPEGGQVQLQLISGNIMQLYKNREELLSFTFYSKTDGSPDTCSFESAQFPGWFLSSSVESNKPLGLSQKGGPENILFHFQRIN
ncbi:interleukin-1 family member 10-like [Crotalus adamanteus]|uniref:Interleukin-1 receptor antagonist protein n=1 Tax=Crotalus adamanteus TaxID=8729 RepID=A0AAW1AZE1_CROAD